MRVNEIIMRFSERIKRFFVTIGQSCYNMELYRQVRSRSWVSALGYSAAFFALVSFVLTLATVPGSFSLLSELEQAVMEQVPEGADFTIKDGKFSTGLQPGTEFGDEQFVFVLDDSLEGLEYPKAFENRIGAYVGQDAAFVQSEDGVREIMPFEEAPEVSLTRESILQWISDYGVLAVSGLLVLFLGLHYSLSVLGALFYVVLMSVLVMLIGRVWKVRISYAMWFAMGLHAITLPTLIDYVFGFLGLDVPFAFSAVFFMILFSVIADERAKPVIPAPSEPVEPTA
jgi:hypothetical protein